MGWKFGRRASWAGLLLACTVCAGPAGSEAPVAGSGGADCIGRQGIAGLEARARAAGAPERYELWQQAADAAATCARRSGDPRGWYAFLQASDEFFALHGESEVLARAPAIAARLDALAASGTDPLVMQAARRLRDDVLLVYRQTRALVAARATPVATPEPTLSPYLLNQPADPLGLNFRRR